MTAKQNRREVGIEFARIVGCLIVIGVHVSLRDYVNHVYDLSRGFINCLLADGAAIFWMITGCFLFRTRSYRQLVKRTVKNIVWPVLLLTACCFYLGGFLFNGESIAASMAHPMEDYKKLIESFLLYKPISANIGTLWYCYAYILVMLAFPVLLAFVQWMDQDRRREIWFLAVSFGFLLINDLTKNKAAAFSHHSINAAFPAAIEMLYGHILYRHKDTLLAGKRRVAVMAAAPVIFLLLNLLRTYLVHETGSKTILFWYTTIGVLCAVCVIGFCTALCSSVQGDSRRARMITMVSSYTSVIYMIHFPIMQMLNRHGWKDRCFAFCSRYAHGFALELLYTAVMVLGLFAVTFCVGILLRGIVRAGNSLGKRCSMAISRYRVKAA